MEKNKSMKCSELQPEDTVVFKVDPNHLGNKKVYDGTVFRVDKKHKKVLVSYLDGYKDRTDDISYEDMIAVYDEAGEMMSFHGVRGKSILLEPQ